MTASSRTQVIRYEVGARTTALPIGVVARDSLFDGIDDSLRQMTRTAVGLTAKEVQLVKDVRRGRYITGVLKTLEIGHKCEDVADATAFPEALRGWVVRHHPRLATCWQSAFRAETDANGVANLAQFEFEVDPTESNRQRAIEALNRQLVETHRALNALHRHDGRLSLSR